MVSGRMERVTLAPGAVTCSVCEERSSPAGVVRRTCPLFVALAGLISAMVAFTRLVSPRNSATNLDAGLRYMSVGEPIWTTEPLRMTAMRSAMLSASF